MIAIAGLATCLLVASVASLGLARANSRERNAHSAAERSRRENLSTSAMFLAKSLANEIDLYWRLMENQTQSARLRNWMASANEELRRKGDGDGQLTKPTQRELQSWLEKRYIAEGDTVRSLAWCLYSIDGTQVARVPEGGSIGKNFQHRDYFHGQGHDLTPAELAKQQSIIPLANNEHYVSAVFRGTNTNTLLQTFSVPIWSRAPDDISREDITLEDTARERIGVMAIPIELGGFSLGRTAMLVDTRVDQINQRRGLVLHHPMLGSVGRDKEPTYVSETNLDQIRRIVADRAAAVTFQIGGSNLIESFDDPVEKTSRLVAIEPVVIAKRPSTGLVVVVTENE